MREQIGVDIPRLLALRQRYGFDIQLEDPYTLWNLGPDRFRLIGDLYRRRLPAGAQLAIDINVVDRDPDPGQILVTERQHGLELYGLVSACAEHADTVYFYAAYSLETPDMQFAPSAAAHAQLTPLPDGQLRYTTRAAIVLAGRHPRLRRLPGQPALALPRRRPRAPPRRHAHHLPAPGTGIRRAAPPRRLNATLLDATSSPTAAPSATAARAAATSPFPTRPTIRIDGSPPAPVARAARRTCCRRGSIKWKFIRLLPLLLLLHGRSRNLMYMRMRIRKRKTWET